MIWDLLLAGIANHPKQPFIFVNQAFNCLTNELKFSLIHEAIKGTRIRAQNANVNERVTVTQRPLSVASVNSAAKRPFSA